MGYSSQESQWGICVPLIGMAVHVHSPGTALDDQCAGSHDFLSV